MLDSIFQLPGQGLFDISVTEFSFSVTVFRYFSYRTLKNIFEIQLVKMRTKSLTLFLTPFNTSHPVDNF